MIPNVTVIQEHLPHYRKLFFELAREDLARKGVTLDLIHGRTKDTRFVSSPLEWGHQVPIRRLGPFSWHANTLSLCRDTDLIIVPQETKYLISHLLQFSSHSGGSKFAFWGHGKSFQASDHDAIKEKAKRWLSRHVDWWFAYNDFSARIVEDLGYPKERITSVGNAVDTKGMIQCKESVTEAELVSIRMRLGLESENIAVYTGGLYPNKRIPFLLESALVIRQRIPDFSLIVIGEGPDRHLVTEAAGRHPWIHDLGAMNDEEKTPYWMLSKLLLMPGLVGLVVVDSFALGTPMVTTDYPYHSPEIDYLRQGNNGEIVKCGEDTGIYAEAVCRLLTNPEETEKLREGALRSAPEHTIEKMVENFTSGVLAALKAPRR